MIVTTARKHAELLLEKATKFSTHLNAKLVVRSEMSIEDMITFFQEDLLVVGKGKVTLYPLGGGEPFFYHPNSAMFRVKQFLKTGYDPLIETAGLKQGMSLLDCTLGLASDALVAQIAVGSSGLVTGLEASPILAFLVENGLQSWSDGDTQMLQAMKEINVIHQNHLEYLQNAAKDSYDVVYFDPMFELHLSSSKGISGLKNFAAHDDLTVEVISHAKRVARNRVVIKDHYQSTRFKRFGFTVIPRQHSAFHYGFIEQIGLNN